MAAKTLQKPEYVTRSVPRQDGGWLIVTSRKNSGSSPVELREGSQVIIRDGLAVQP